jgi:methionyl-tRNA formyltransferase
MKIVFMGTPEFAIPTLKALLNSKHEVVAVYTQPPKPKGRKYDIVASPIQILAEENKIPVRHPKSLKTEDIQKEFKSLNADIAIVIAYGLLLPKPILEAYKYGCINVHPSLLPRFRGAAPIQYTLLEGDIKTAVCIMQMDEGFDTGDILMTQEVDIPVDIYYPALHNQLAQIGASLILKTLDNITNIKPIKQTEDGLVYANKVEKSHGLIDWHKPANQIYNMIRAFNPWPGTYLKYNNNNIIIRKATYIASSSDDKPGTIINANFHIACGSGILIPEVLQKAGKNEMSLKEFLNGFKFNIGEILE